MKLLSLFFTLFFICSCAIVKIYRLEIQSIEILSSDKDFQFVEMTDLPWKKDAKSPLLHLSIGGNYFFYGRNKRVTLKSGAETVEIDFIPFTFAEESNSSFMYFRVYGPRELELTNVDFPSISGRNCFTVENWGSSDLSPSEATYYRLIESPQKFETVRRSVVMLNFAEKCLKEISSANWTFTYKGRSFVITTHFKVSGRWFGMTSQV